jgi:AcrR family transcriptional regulator
MAGRPLGREARRRALRRVALELLGERGFAGFGMREVAQRTGQSVANVYHHVADKEELVYAALADRLAAARASAEAVLAVRGARDRLRALATDHLRRVLESPAEAAFWRGDVPPLHEPQARRLGVLRDEYEEMARRVVDDVVGRKGERRLTSWRRMRLLLALVERAARDLAEAPTPARTARAAAEALQVFLEGTRPRRSR